MRKEYREALISGISIAVGVTIILYMVQGKVPWAFLFTYPIFSFILHLYLNKRREAKKEENDQLSRKF